MESAGESELFYKFEGVFDYALAVNYVWDKCSLSCTLDSSRHHLLVLLAVACKSSGHNLVSLGERVLEHIEIFVVYELYLLLAVAAVSLLEFSSFSHCLFS